MWWKIIAAIAALALAAGFFLWMKRRRKRKEIELRAEDRLREEALERVLVDGQRDIKRGQAAFDVRYDTNRRGKKNADQAQGNGKSPVMLQLTEQSELSTRKYMLHAANRLSIGSKPGVNDVVISGSEIAAIQCEIVRVGKNLYISNLGDKGQVLLRRGKKQMLLERDAVELQNGDLLQIGGFTFKADILRD